MFSDIISLESYNIFLIVMAAIAVVVFIALYFVEAGYGYLFNPKYEGGLWLPLQPQVWLPRTQQGGMGAHGVPRILCHGVFVVDVSRTLRGCATRAIRNIPVALLPAFVHLPLAHPWQLEDARGYHAYGHDL